MITEAKRSRPRNGVPVLDLFRCTMAPPRGLTVVARDDRRAIDDALSAVRDWAATRDDGPPLDESALTMLAAILYRQQIAPLRAELGRAMVELDAARAELAAANGELGERREVERAARVRKEMASERRNPQLRAEVRDRDGDACRYCGTDVTPSTAVLDQVAPDVAAGVDNLVMACKACRRRKGAKTLDESGLTLLPVPEVPRIVDAPTVVDAPGAVGAVDAVDTTDLIPIANPNTGRKLLTLPRAEAVAWAEGILARCRASEGEPNADRAVILTPSNMHGAFDSNGYDVYCPKAEQVAWANGGFCQFCGATDHARVGASA